MTDNPTDALLELADSLQWRPIEEAPKDERVLIKVNGDVHAAIWVKNIMNDDETWAIAKLPKPDGGFDRVILRNPTHFMPIPTGNEGAVIRELVEALKIYAEENNDPEELAVIALQKAAALEEGEM